MKRRHFLITGAAGAAMSLARPTWAMAGAPAYLTAASKAGNSTWLVGLTEAGDVVFELPIPSRGHAAAAHPYRAEAVAFARRPGRFAVVLDCATGKEIARLDSPEGRHFYGHGAFTADGKLLLTTENAYEIPAGKLGVWDAEDGYKRIGEISSGGIGPHEMIRLNDGGFAVANGGMQTHPDYERAVLNIPTMQPNLTYLDAAGEIIDQVEPPTDMRLNSIRHIAADASGRVVIALQWQGNPLAPVPLMASHRRGEELTFFNHPETAKLKQYAGSIAISADGSEIAMTGPKGGHVLFFDGVTGAPINGRALPEASGVAQFGDRFAITLAGGLLEGGADGGNMVEIGGGYSWDNHLVSIRQG
ncbi:DUF1513 domain-containing protein [Donghicola mangrovi]|nr:DUF1513 domain-containing protein [Donghicola mangrovi]